MVQYITILVPATSGFLVFTKCVNESLRETHFPENLDTLLPYTLAGTNPKPSTTVTSNRSESAIKMRILLLILLVGPAPRAATYLFRVSWGQR